MSIANHVPSCQCAECKPPLGPALQPQGETFRAHLELSFDIDAEDYFTAAKMAEVLSHSIELEVGKCVPAKARVLGVERKI
jgi:hypothetical protein